MVAAKSTVLRILPRLQKPKRISLKKSVDFAIKFISREWYGWESGSHIKDLPIWCLLVAFAFLTTEKQRTALNGKVSSWLYGKMVWHSIPFQPVSHMTGFYPRSFLLSYWHLWLDWWFKRQCEAICRWNINFHSLSWSTCSYYWYGPWSDPIKLWAWKFYPLTLA